ncbi:putative T7SS-secreted protein [Nocardioides sp. CFH 31398]|uniref:putative T7SS-secreted protein n=1 Tax=Nocardioides sp. CFH 31398 TaxID=2919579 RepID=UPI001F062016|nr:hypothetical protein [Nocardioides sp. CFH 31398]MCH1865405.1 hypothetical protein [Nocardioides sp. CFH 31398]
MSLDVKELGETEDPKEIVPGEPGQVRTAATTFTDEGERMTRIGVSLAGLSAPSWEGGAAETFNAAFPDSIKPWSEIGGDAKSAGRALSDHAGVLGAAQAKAQQAIEKYKAGKEAQARALAEHNAAVDAYNANLGSTGTLGGGGGHLAPPGAFHDPGIERMREAQEMVEEAREQVKESVETTTTALAKLPGTLTAGARPDPDSTFGDITIALPGGERPWNDEDLMTPYGDAVDEDGDGRDDRTGLEVTMDLGSVETPTARVWGAEGSFENQVGDVTLSGDGEVNVLSANAGAGLEVGTGGLAATANAGAYLAQAEGQVSAQYGYATVGAEGSAMVGAEAEGEVSVGTDGVHAGGEVFAGARAEGALSGDVGGVGGAVTGEAWAGVGASADLDVGMNEDGSFTIGGHLGAALGVGGQLGGEITIDPGEVVDTAEDLAEGIGDGAEEVGDAIGDAASSVGDALGF